MLSIVETLKQLSTILLGHHITIYIEHKNLSYENFITESLIYGCLLLEEYSPRVKYIKGTDNYDTDALKRLLLINHYITESDIIR